jgi:hypothetical protein
MDIVEEQNRRNRYKENPPNCMGGIREFNCACLIVSLLLALLLNTSLSFTLPRIICLVFYNINFISETRLLNIFPLCGAMLAVFGLKVRKKH